MPPIKVIYQLSHGKPQRHQLKLTSDWQQTVRNVTEIISPPFDARTEEMKRNSQNIFELFKTLRNLSR